MSRSKEYKEWLELQRVLDERIRTHSLDAQCLIEGRMWDLYVYPEDVDPDWDPPMDKKAKEIVDAYVTPPGDMLGHPLYDEKEEKKRQLRELERQ